ncbi:MAG TPA: FoF1 ATP synthase subunit gamma [Candidatus Sulfomarinibacteraceae bacterium]|nr:FoF1 ATP synthase subunit gamma [Candidatus Sulfomarinibacteraceae bacterium]
MPQETIETVRRRIQGAHELQSVVKTMKALSAAEIWHYERAVEALDEYMRTVELGLRAALHEHVEELAIAEKPLRHRLGAIVLGSDMGFVGRFNEQIVTFSLEEMEEMQPDEAQRNLIVMGRRARTRLAAEGQPVVIHDEMPRSLEGVLPHVRRLARRLFTWFSEKRVDHILLFYNRPVSAARYEPVCAELLPIDLTWLQAIQAEPWVSRSLPLTDLGWNELFQELIGEYFFVTVYRAFVASLAAEHASRLASMQSAEENIEKRLEALQRAYHQQRQNAITEELGDIISGAEATRGREDLR